MTDFRVRAMETPDHTEVAELICASMNVWDILHGGAPGRFTGGPAQTAVFPDVYERLDPGHCLVAEDLETGRLLGSCFYRARETHVSLGIMNVHPNHFGKGVAKALIEPIIDFQEREQKPLRLVSSVMNLESFSLYTKYGFVPKLLYQDILLACAGERARRQAGRARARSGRHGGRRRGARGARARGERDRPSRRLPVLRRQR